VIGHVGPEAALGGPIVLIEDGDTIVIDLDDDALDYVELGDAATFEARTAEWREAAATNGGQHPLVRPVTSQLLRRMRAVASPAIAGGGMATP
jgi:dihydroxy-acid dehydratase